jgi:hydrogenase/urease accessory protein HupE
VSHAASRPARHAARHGVAHGIVALLIALLTAAASAHEVRPGFLELRAASDGGIDVLWKAPMRDGYAFPITPVLPPACHDRLPPSRQAVAGSLIERRRIDCADALAGATITIDGLATTLTDVIVRIDLPGVRQTVLLKPASPSLTITGQTPWTTVARDYLVLGIEHILLGIDHLLFVLGLMLLVRSSWPLVKTITAFTVAHSLTLAAATLGWVHVAAAPVEAMIALSIAFLAAEIVHGHRGRTGITHRLPWLVAFTFGLLHGFGFAGALAEVGLPETDIPLALLFFNLGVEVGQLAFIAAIAVVYTLGSRISRFDLRRLETVTAYGIGGIAGFWVIERVGAML